MAATAIVKYELRLKKAVDECKELMDSLDIPYDERATVVINSRAKRRWGQTFLDGKTKKFTISIAERLLQDDVDEKSLKNTILHEFLHTAPGCMNHGDKWLRYANKINAKYKYNVQRVDGDKTGIKLVDDSEYKYIFECKDCGHQFKYLRRPKWTDYCEKAKHGTCKTGLVRIK